MPGSKKSDSKGSDSETSEVGQPCAKQLLIVAHAPSPNTLKLRNAVAAGANHNDIENVNVTVLAPLDAGPEDVLACDAIILGTTENLGYMSGALKDFFDRCYYPCLEKTQGLPFTFYIRAGHDGTGTRRAIDSITIGLRWKLVQEPLLCRGNYADEFEQQCEELGLYIAASLDNGLI
ncbi:flavodoxin [Marinobacter psychrophilus]|jgi:hypothetical protein|uniref:Flavodoxin n=1 Tax=Marinobacter psychrophilus TaxID=330734 RepID=A0A0H4IDF0_9GAMM|nr:flavodoxin family protein [Marinobacter psychrophilus]AKO53032.1 flavodoxin [Marinobacter psychrophilus]